jgi:hypothetical protein
MKLCPAWLRFKRGLVLAALACMLGVAGSQETPSPQDLDRQFRSAVETELKRTASNAGFPLNLSGLTIASNRKGFAAMAMREDLNHVGGEEMAKGGRIGVLLLSADASATSSSPRIPAGSYILQEARGKHGHSTLLLLDDTGKVVAALHGKVGKTSMTEPAPRIRFGGCDYWWGEVGAGSICLYRYCPGYHSFTLTAWCVQWE